MSVRHRFAQDWCSPRSARATPTLHEIPPYLRDLVGKHAVVYRVTADGEVLIVRVLHAAMLPSEFVLLLETPWGFVTQDEVR